MPTIPSHVRKITKKVLLTGILMPALLFTGCSNTEKVVYDSFAKCLTESGFTMYGAFWCPHCADQKEMFGDAFQYIDYVECDPRDEAGQPELCLEKGVESYPTWIYKDGRKWEGVQSFDALGEVAKCDLPE